MLPLATLALLAQPLLPCNFKKQIIHQCPPTPSSSERPACNDTHPLCESAASSARGCRELVDKCPLSCGACPHVRRLRFGFVVFACNGTDFWKNKPEAQIERALTLKRSLDRTRSKIPNVAREVREEAGGLMSSS